MTAAEAYAAAGLKILERDGDTIHAAIQTPKGEVSIMAELVRVGQLLIIDGVPVDGQGLTISRIRQLAQVFGEVEDVVEVIVQGGVRTSGAHPGSRPTPIRVEVKR